MELYWDIGELIVTRQESAGWGKSVVEQLAQDLQVEFHGKATLKTEALCPVKILS